MRFHIALIAALVEKIGNRKCDCTRLQATYAYNLDICTWRYTPMINISHYMSTETLSRKEIHMFEARTHKQCFPDYSTLWSALVARGDSVQYIMQHAAVTFTQTTPLVCWLSSRSIFLWTHTPRHDSIHLYLSMYISHVHLHCSHYCTRRENG